MRGEPAIISDPVSEFRAYLIYGMNDAMMMSCADCGLDAYDIRVTAVGVLSVGEW